MFYIFRSTTAQLTGHLEHIEESGDSVLGLAFVGEKHWIIVCRKGEQRQDPDLAEHASLVNELAQTPAGKLREYEQVLQGHRTGDER